MKKIIASIILLLIPTNVFAYQTSATSAILMDMDSSRILYADNINEERSVASISKIMTAILAVESEKLEETVTIGEEIKAAYGSAIYIQVGEEIKLKDLVYGLMLRSGNDAALAIAHYVSGSVDAFVTHMNEKAKEIGMNNTTFNNPSGLDENKGNYSTAYDMALLTSYAMKNDIYKEITATKEHNVKTNKNSYSWDNKNKLLFNYEYATGGKTGYTEIAKRTLVTTAAKDNLNLVAVTLNDGNDFLDHENLFEEAFSEINNYQILKKGNIDIIDEDYYDNYSFSIKEDFYYPLYKGEEKAIILNFKLNKLTEYENDDEIGIVEVLLGDNKLFETNIFLKEKEKEKFNLFEFIGNLFK